MFICTAIKLIQKNFNDIILYGTNFTVLYMPPVKPLQTGPVQTYSTQKQRDHVLQKVFSHL